MTLPPVLLLWQLFLIRVALLLEWQSSRRRVQGARE